MCNVMEFQSSAEGNLAIKKLSKRLDWNNLSYLSSIHICFDFRYWARRLKNNQAAKRSRDMRIQREKIIFDENSRLEGQNKELRRDMDQLTTGSGTIISTSFHCFYIFNRDCTSWTLILSCTKVSLGLAWKWYFSVTLFRSGYQYLTLAYLCAAG